MSLSLELQPESRLEARQPKLLDRQYARLSKDAPHFQVTGRRSEELDRAQVSGPPPGYGNSTRTLRGASLGSMSRKKNMLRMFRLHCQVSRVLSLFESA